MLKVKTNYMIAFVTLAVLSLFRVAMPTSFNIDEALSPQFENFPRTIGDWSGEDEAVEEKVYEILETRNVLSRVYTDSKGMPIHLLLVASRNDRRVAHPPEVCYVSSNYEIVNEGTYEFDSSLGKIPVREFIARSERNQADQQQVLYLYKVGSQLTTNYYSQQLQFAFDKLTKGNSEVFLIRVAGAEKEPLEKFLAEILAILDQPSA